MAKPPTAEKKANDAAYEAGSPYEKAARRAEAAAVGGALSKAEQDRLRVIQALDSKRAALIQAKADLHQRMIGATLVRLNSLRWAIGEVMEEEHRINARIAALKANEAFTPLPQAEEKKLLEAIRNVGRKAETTAAVGELVEAVVNLVETYQS